MPTSRMRPFSHTISLEAARAILDRTGLPVTSAESISLEAASNRVIANDVVAPFDVPPFARAAMDGYAVRAEDTEGATRSSPRSLRLAGTVYTGQVSAVRI